MCDSSFPRTGTTSPIFVSRDPRFAPLPVTAGQDYFLIQVYAAQVAFRGAIWDSIKRLVVTSQVNLHHRNLDNRPMRAIQRTRDVRKNQCQPLGLTPNLVALVPAVMPNISLSIDFVLDRENRMAQLSSLINSDSFNSALSLAPGTSAVAKVIAQLTDKVIQTFIPAQDNKPLLAFSGDFNIATKQLQDGYYVILGSTDDENPLPEPAARLEVPNGGLLVDGRPANQWSYIILDVRLVGTRPRELNDSAVWAAKLREAEDEAERVSAGLSTDDQDRKNSWTKCMELIKDAQTLLRADDNFLPKDASSIAMAALWNCRQWIANQPSRRGTGGVEASNWQPPLANDLAALGLAPVANLDSEVDKYIEQLKQARQTLQDAGTK